MRNKMFDFLRKFLFLLVLFSHGFVCAQSNKDLKASQVSQLKPSSDHKSLLDIGTWGVSGG